MSGASQNLSIYMFIRVLVSSYLFLNGYGHLCHHWKQQQKQDQTPNGIDSGRFQDFDGIVRFLSVRETVYYKLPVLRFINVLIKQIIKFKETREKLINGMNKDY